MMHQLNFRLLSNSAPLFIATLALVAFSAHASTEEEEETKVVANDSNSVQLGDILGGDPGGDTVTDFLGGGGGGTYDLDELSDGTEVPEEGETTVGVGGESGGGSDAENLYNSILESGGFSGGSGAQSVGGSNSGNSGIFINGEVSRSALRQLGIQKLSIRGLAGSSGTKKARALTSEEMGIVAASKVLDDENIESAYIALDTLEISYRSLGRLFGVIPLPFTLKITIEPESLVQSERVRLKYPWYKFFLRTYVSQSDLRAEIDNAIAAARSSVTSGEFASDAQAALFVAVSEILKARSDAVAGT